MSQRRPEHGRAGGAPARNTDSHVKQRHGAAPTYGRAPSTPIVSEARGGASFFFPLACARERSAGRRFGNSLAPDGGAACLCSPARAPPGAPPRRFFTRSPYFLIGPEGFTAPFQAALALPFIRSCPATKGGPLNGTGR